MGQVAPTFSRKVVVEAAPLTGRRSLVAILGVAFVLATPAAATPTWGTPVQVSTGDRARPRAGHERGWRRTRRLGPGGRAGARRSRRPLLRPHRHCRRPVPGSTAWATPVEISRPGVGAQPRAGIDPNGNAAIMWVHDIGRDRVLQATYRHGPAGTWPEPSDLSEPVLEVRDHRIALDGAGNAIAVWAERSADTFVVRGEIRSAQSGVWEAPVRLSAQERTCPPGLPGARGARARRRRLGRRRHRARASSTWGGGSQL